MLTRRQLFGTSAAAATLPLLPVAAHADGHSAASALPAAQRFAIGDITVTALNDGALRIGPEALSGIDADGYAAAMEAQFRDPDTFRAPVNAFLVESGGSKMLVDAGAGGAMGDAAGRLMMNLAATGTDPAEITMLLATHLHPDHVGGAIDAEGAALFPNAELVHHADEAEFWLNTAPPEGSEGFFALAGNAVSAYSDRLRGFEGEADIAPGVTALPLPGHTPGHSGFMISSGDAGLLIWADILHVAPVQLANPAVTIGFDVNPDQAAATRAQILDRALADRMMIAGSHIDFPGLGHIMRAGDGYALIDAPYDYDA